MKATATVILVSVLGVAAAACGEQFTLTNGAGGAGGAGSTKASASTTSSTSAMVATDAVATSSSSSSSSSGMGSSSVASTGAAPPPPACTVASPDCGADAFCVVPSCGSGDGTCVALSMVNKGGFSPLCGCDGNTYWSGVEAIANQQAVRDSGECGNSANTCGPTMACTGGTYCSMEVSSCKSLSTEGKCWVLPADCSLHAEGAQPCAGIVTLDGGGQTCASICKMIMQSVVWMQTKPFCTP